MAESKIQTIPFITTSITLDYKDGLMNLFKYGRVVYLNCDGNWLETLPNKSDIKVGNIPQEYYPYSTAWFYDVLSKVRLQIKNNGDVHVFSDNNSMMLLSGRYSGCWIT